jgi:hypothetical protein
MGKIRKRPMREWGGNLNWVKKKRSIPWRMLLAFPAYTSLLFPDAARSSKEYEETLNTETAKKPIHEKIGFSITEIWIQRAILLIFISSGLVGRSVDMTYPCSPRFSNKRKCKRRASCAKMAHHFSDSRWS